MKLKHIFSIVILLLLISCKDKDEKSLYNTEEMNDLEERMQLVTSAMDNYIRYEEVKDYMYALHENEKLVFDYDNSELDEKQRSYYLKFKMRVDSTNRAVNHMLDKYLNSMEVSYINKSDYLMESAEAFPFYLQRGEVLNFKISANSSVTTKIYNADTRALIKTYSQKRELNDSLVAPNTAIYLVELTPTKAVYADIAFTRKAKTKDDLLHLKVVKTEVVEAHRNDFRALSTKGVRMTNVFDEPRKFTLRGQLKAAFSGSSRALVAVKVPAGATDILYHLRISTNESDRSDDGEFKSDMDLKYKKIKFLGLPLYESRGGSDLLSTLLGDNLPLREEDAYINMFVFFNSAQAKKFQDGKETSTLNYSVNYSTLGTQSCNGRIPVQGNKTIYFAFENERMRYNNYVWLEVLSVVPCTEYFKAKYTIVEQ